MALERLKAAIGRYRYTFADEAELQDAIAAALDAAGVAYERELRLGHDRLDFLCEGVAIEVKIRGAAGPLARQLRRYATHPEIAALLVVTNLTRFYGMPDEFGGKPLHVLDLAGVK